MSRLKNAEVDAKVYILVRRDRKIVKRKVTMMLLSKKYFEEERNRQEALYKKQALKRSLSLTYIFSLVGRVGEPHKNKSYRLQERQYSIDKATLEAFGIYDISYVEGKNVTSETFDNIDKIILKKRIEDINSDATRLIELREKNKSNNQKIQEINNRLYILQRELQILSKIV